MYVYVKNLLIMILISKMEMIVSYPSTSASPNHTNAQVTHIKTAGPNKWSRMPDQLLTGPTVPTSMMECFSGIIMGNHQQYTSGNWLLCDGYCTNITMNINENPVSIFSCDPLDLCLEAGTSDGCGYIFEGQMTMCCCNDSALCNVRPNLIPSNFNESIFNQNPHPVNVSCFVGVELDQAVNLTDDTSIPPDTPFGVFMDCYGECINVTLDNFGTLYACDPISICHEFKLTNTCETINHRVRGCCCSTDKCNIDLADFPTTSSEVPYSTTSQRKNSCINNHVSYKMLFYIVLLYIICILRFNII